MYFGDYCLAPSVPYPESYVNGVESWVCIRYRANRASCYDPSMNNKLILIAGGSCSGKSTIAQRLVDTSGIQALHFGLDSYYRDARGVPDHEIEVDIPDALDHELIIDHVQQLVAGKAIDQPVYDYASHSRLAATNRVGTRPTHCGGGLVCIVLGAATRYRCGYCVCRCACR